MKFLKPFINIQITELAQGFSLGLVFYVCARAKPLQKKSNLLLDFSSSQHKSGAKAAAETFFLSRTSSKNKWELKLKAPTGSFYMSLCLSANS